MLNTIVALKNLKTYECSSELWFVFLIDQFHDVLPGTSIGQAYDDTRVNAAELHQKTDKSIDQCLEKLYTHEEAKNDLTVVNTTSFDRVYEVEIDGQSQLGKIKAFSVSKFKQV